MQENNPRAVYRRLVKSGNHFEYLTFERPFWVGFPKLQQSIIKYQKSIKQEQKALRNDNVKRTRKMLKRLVNANFENEGMTKFLTLTFKENMTDFDCAWRCLDNFFKRLKRYLKTVQPYLDLKYIGVPEFQERGAIHYHIIIDMPFVHYDILNRLWGHGSLTITKIDEIDNCGAYLVKYMGKTNFDARFFRKRKYLRSRNLQQPLIVDNCEADEVMTFFGSTNLHFTWESEYCSEFFGVINYKYFVLHALKSDRLDRLII